MARFFINRPIVAMVIAIIMVIAGVVAFLGLPVAQYPNIIPPEIQVNTTYVGADALTVERERNKSLGDAALEGARLRLRPILMTSFAFILGCVPLWVAVGAGAVSQQIIGTAVIGGMLAASFIAIFMVPVLFYLVERFSAKKERPVDGKPSVQEGVSKEAGAGMK